MTPLYNLKTKGGKFLDVMKFPNATRLEAVDVQNKECNVSIIQCTTKMAFCFKSEKSFFYLKVNGDKLELEEKKAGLFQPDPKVGNYWFKKEDLGSGEHYGLCTVVSPVKYVSIVRETQLILCNNKSECVLVTHEE